MPESLRMAVAGLGAMGRHHVRVLSSMPDVDLVALADPDASRSESLRLRDLPHFTSVEDMLAVTSVDALIVATPTTHHHAVAIPALRRGVHVLVEKPIAASVPEADDLIALARNRGVTLAVGHIERFNPAVRELKRRLDAGEAGPIFQIRVRREGPFPLRIADVGVTEDLATHDLDIISYLLGQEPEMVYAQTSRRLHATREDLLSAVLRFPGGVLTSLEVNWLSPTKVRELVVNGARGMFVVDYLTQDLTWHENGAVAEGWDTLDTLRGVSEGRIVRYPVPHREPLAVELSAFVTHVKGGHAAVVTAAEGRRALALAQALLQSAASDAPITFPLADLTRAREGARA